MNKYKKQYNRSLKKLQREFPLGSLVEVWEWDLQSSSFTEGLKKSYEIGIITGYVPDSVEDPGIFIEIRLYVYVNGLIEKINANKCRSISKLYRKVNV